MEKEFQLRWYDYLDFWTIPERRRAHRDRQTRARATYDEEVRARNERHRIWSEAHAQWDARRRAYEGACERALAAWSIAEKAWLDGSTRDATELNRIRAGYESANSDMVSLWAAVHLDALPLPAWCPRSRRLAFDAAERVLLIDCPMPYFPALEILTTKQLKSGSKMAPASQKDAREFSNNFSYLLVLVVMWELAHVDPQNRIGLICCNGSIAYDDPATGRPREDVILSVAAKPEELRQLLLDRVDPEACFRKLRGVAAPKLADLVPVRPIVQFDRSDPRFIAAKSVIGQVDGVNLASMDWQDFEFLIRELFERAYASHGAEVRVTQASRDRGVDAVIFDPDPLRGGKTIVQAKRYTATVDVSAVRDLYGTIQAEGANKGILVTTSNFGPDAYDFAKDKPITLLNGANLLHLLEQHGYRARIDLREARELMRERAAPDGTPLN